LCGDTIYPTLFGRVKAKSSTVFCWLIKKENYYRFEDWEIKNFIENIRTNPRIKEYLDI
jgi:hypothetical protein